MKIILTLVILAFSLAGCFVEGVSDESAVAVAVKLRDETTRSTKEAIKLSGNTEQWQSAFDAAVIVKVEAADLSLPVEAREIAKTMPKEDSIELVMEVKPGKQREFSGILFLADSPPLKSYASLVPVTIDLAEGELAEVVLTLDRLGTGTAIIEIESTENGWDAVFTDAKTDLELLTITCEPSDTVSRCEATDLPQDRLLTFELHSPNGETIVPVEHSLTLRSGSDSTTITISDSQLSD